MSSWIRCVLVVLLPWGLSRAVEVASPSLHRLDPAGGLRIEVADHLHHPHFWWPETLVTYRLAYDPAVSDPGQFELQDGTGQVVPIQVAPLARGICTLSFLTDLPSGARRSFTLSTVPHPRRAEVPKPVTITEEPAALVLDTGLLRVRVPRTLSGRVVPGPWLACDEGRGWIGTSRLVVPGERVTALTTSIREAGPLRARVEVVYTLAGGGTYRALLTAKHGYDFIELDEAMQGLPTGAQVEVDWIGFAPTHRRGQESIDEPKILYFRGEDPFFTGPAGVEDPAKEMYVRVAPANADSTINTVALDFTDRPGGRAVGVAVREAGRWDDGAYALWASGEALALRFRYAQGLLTWTLPLATGRRYLAIAAYDPRRATTPATDEDDDEAIARAIANTGRAPGKARIDLIASRYAGMGLDVVKDWVLTYDAAAPRPTFAHLPHQEGKAMSSPQEYLKALWGAKNEALKVEGAWVSPVGLRVMSAWMVPGFVRFRDAFTPEERARATALLLFHAYIAAREEVSPVRHLLRGHPNFMADWKYPLMAGSALFPRHPLAVEWGEQFEKTLALMGTFWVRPTVGAWGTRGGRWTESIATYNWAFWEPTLRANALGVAFDGRQRVTDPGLALHGDYLVGIASAPVRLGKDGVPLQVTPGTALTAANGFQRIHPAQGAHGGRRAVPTSAEELGEALRRYRPLTAEHLRWLARRPGTRTSDGGTNPRLTSAAYTGYGVVLRAAVDTPDEVAVVLQQIDKGPNYRWGFANEGGCGDVYYYAAGRSFSGHLGEDTGDRRATDAELTCTTGVYKDQTFRGIGMNDLTEPFYDLGAAQYAEIRARSGPDAYAWPEYQSRAVLLVGHDYALTFDVVNGCSRTVWNTVAGEDAKPTLLPLRGEVAFTVEQRTTGKGHAAGTAEAQRFDCYKGAGDRLLLVSHQPGVTAKDRRNGLTEVAIDDRRDLVLLQRREFTLDDPAVAFTGRAAVVRTRPTGPTELVLFHGRRLAAQGFALEVDQPDLGVSAVALSSTEIQGRAFSRTGGTLVVTRPAGGPVTVALNGVPVATTADLRLSLTLPPGAHRWQITAGPVEPLPAVITASEARQDGVTITVPAVPSATHLLIERSDDGGLTWAPAGAVADGRFTLSGLIAPARCHLRPIAINGTVAALPGRDYPVEVTGVPVLPPAGLRVTVPEPGQVTATWGEVLGAREYRLYRQDDQTWIEVFRGPATTWSGAIPGVIPAYRDPGLEAAVLRPAPAGSVVRFAVAAVDAIGEGPRSEVITTDPTSWRSWNPGTPQVFKRQTAYWLPPYVRQDQVPPLHYPD